MSRYIMQEDFVQPMLTVRETMLISADLKLGNDLSKVEKIKMVCITCTSITNKLCIPYKLYYT